MALIFTRRWLTVTVCLAAVAASLAPSPGAQSRPAPTPIVRPTLPEMGVRLTDQEFWKLISAYSEPDGVFNSDNLISNERRFQQIVPRLVTTVVPGRAYLGVGSEQNFTYIAATRPAIAFIVDLRRGNLDLHLAYKALFELSADRAEFVSRLFSRKRPAGLTSRSTAREIFDAMARVPRDETLFSQNLTAITAHLTTKHGFALTPVDHQGLKFVYRSWFEGGPDLRYELSALERGRGTRGYNTGRDAPSYADLMTADDGQGHNRSYLATEETFRWLKDFHTRNLILPVVGNFAGPSALRAVAGYLKDRQHVVSVFYVSNVEQYLRRDGRWEAFCANAAQLPRDDRSVFIRTEGVATGFTLDLVPMANVITCRRTGTTREPLTGTIVN